MQRHVRARREGTYGLGIDVVAIREEEHERLVHVVLPETGKVWIPIRAVNHRCGRVGGRVIPAEQLRDVLRQCTQNAPGAMQWRLDGELQMLAEPTSNGRDLREREEEGITIAGVAQVFQTPERRCGREGRGRCVANFPPGDSTSANST